MKRLLFIISLLVCCLVTPLVAQEQNSLEKNSNAVEVGGIGTSEALAVETLLHAFQDRVLRRVPIGIGEDGAGTESSWGTSSFGERNGLSASGTCGSTAKDTTAVCP